MFLEATIKEQFFAPCGLVSSTKTVRNRLETIRLDTLTNLEVSKPQGNMRIVKVCQLIREICTGFAISIYILKNRNPAET